MPPRPPNGHIYCVKCKRSFFADVFYEKHIDHAGENYKSTQTDEMHTHKYVSQIVQGNIVVLCSQCGDVKVVKAFVEIPAKLYEKQDKKRVKFGKK